MTIKIVLASENQGKLKEFNELLAPLGFDVCPQSAFGIKSLPETAPTFVENAIVKARHASKLSGLPALADDSGLEVRALKGAPGIYSARYAGEACHDENNIQKLLKDLDHIENRQANFYCALVLCRHDSDPAPIIAEGVLNGEILKEASGSQGFGYDPIFYVPEYERSMAELLPEEKNQISHRGKAIQHLIKQLNNKEI